MIWSMESKTKKKILFFKVLKRTAVMVELHVFPSFHPMFGKSETVENGKYLWFTEHHLNEIIIPLNDFALAKVLSGGQMTRSKPLKQQTSTSNLSVSSLDLHASYYFKKRHANELFVVPTHTGKHENFKLFPEKLVVIVSQLEKENTRTDTHLVQQVESAQCSSVSPARPGISSYFTKQVATNVTDSTKKKQLSLQKIVRRAENKQPETTQPLLPLPVTTLSVTKDMAGLKDDSGNKADVDCSAKQNFRHGEHDPLIQESTTLVEIEKNYIVESSDGKNDSGIKGFQEDHSSSVEVGSGDQRKTCEGHTLTLSVVAKETKPKELKTKGKGSLKLKKRKIGCDDVTSGSETVDIDLSDFELKPKTGTKRLRQNSTTETLEPAAAQNALKLCSVKDTVEGTGTMKGQRGRRSKLKTREGRKGVAQKTKGRYRVPEQSSTSVSEECFSEEELCKYNKNAFVLEKVDEESVDDTLPCSTRVQELTARSEATAQPRKGSVKEINDDFFEKITSDQITVQDNTPDFSNVKKIKDLAPDHIEHIVWSKKAELRCIFEGKKYCQRHEDYKKGGKLKENLAFQVRFGGFSDEQHEVMMDVLISMFCYKNSKYLDYVTKVLLPETMVMVYQEIFKVSSEEVEKLLIEETSAKV